MARRVREAYANVNRNVNVNQNVNVGFTPYLWASAMEGEASFKGIAPQPVDMSFGDIWENLDFAALGAFEPHNGRWGLGTDVVFMNLGARNAW